MGDFLTKGDAEFSESFKSLCQYVTIKTAGSSPDWKHIPKEEVEALDDAFIAWHTAYDPCTKPHTRPETIIKNKVRKVAEKAIRGFKHRNLDYRPETVTDADFTAMKFHVRDTTITKWEAPAERPGVHVENTRNLYEKR